MSRPIGLETPPPVHETKQRLIEAGLRLMLERGYHAVGIQDLLSETDVPRGSFYHHFASKEDFALQVIDAYQANVRALLQSTCGDTRCPPLERIRVFFAEVQRAYEQEGYLGCFLGALGQELSGASAVFRQKIDGCLAHIAEVLAGCLADARDRGQLAASSDPRALAEVLVSAWEGAALRSRLVRRARPLEAVLDFYFAAIAPR